MMLTLRYGVERDAVDQVRTNTRGGMEVLRAQDLDDRRTATLSSASIVPRAEASARSPHLVAVARMLRPT